MKSDWEIFIHEHYGGTEYEKLLMPTEEMSDKEPVKKNLKTTYDQGKNSPFECLPNEILLKIVNYLHIKDLLRCGQTCRRIRAVVHDESLWKKVNLSCNSLVPTGLLQLIIEHGCEYLNISDQIVGNLTLNRASQLKYLTINQKYNYKYFDANKIWDPLVSSCHSLEKLQLTNFDLTSSLIKRICTQNGKTLKVLKLNWFRSSSLASIELSVIQQVIDQCVKLEELTFCQTILTGLAIKYMIQNISPKVTKISICNNLAVRHIKGPHIHVLVGRFETLDLFRTVMNKLENFSPNIRNEDFEAKLQNFRREVPNVEIVHIAPAYGPLFKQGFSDNISNFRQ